MADIFGTNSDDQITGTDDGDTIIALGGSDEIDAGGDDDIIIIGADGSDTIDGGAGHDTVVLSGSFSDYAVSFDGGSIILASAGATERLTNVEAVVLDDKMVHVVGAGSESFGSIQAAIDAANAGDVIIVAEGTYTESLTIDKAITLVAAGDVVLEATSGSPVTIAGDLAGGDVSINGFAIVGLATTDGVVVAENANVGTLTLDNVTISDAGRFGVFVNGEETPDTTLSELVITNSTFDNNGYNGGPNTAHIKLFGFTGDATIRDVVINGATAGADVADRPDNAIEVTGVINAVLGDVEPSTPIGDFTIDAVTVTGAFHKNPVAIFNFGDVDGLAIGGTGDLDLSGAESDWGPLFNIDGITADVDASGFALTLPDGVVATELQGDKSGQASTGQTITGTDAGDRLIGKGGDDHLVGGDGDDELYGHDKPGEPQEGDAGSDILDGGAGNDMLFGGDGGDTLLGGDGHDTLDGGAGDDLLEGGDGDDLYLVDADDTIIEAVDGGIDTVVSSTSHTLADNVENLTLTDLASNAEDFEDFDLGPIADGENGWVYAGVSDQGVIVDPNNPANQVFRMSSDPSTGAFGGPYSPALPSTAGEPSTSAAGDSMQVSFVFQAIQPNDFSRLEVDFGVDSADDRNNFMVIENTAEGIRIAVADPLLDGTWDTGGSFDDFTAFTGNRTLVSGVDASVAHHLTMVVHYVDGPDNDVVEFFLDGKPIGTSTTFENYFDFRDGGAHQDNAEAHQTSRLFFRNSGAGAPEDGEGGDNQGFMFDDIEYSVFNSGQVDGTGNGLDNFITGNSAGNALSGLDGNDTLLGGVGRDTLTGGSGNDTLDGGVGLDTAVFSGSLADYAVSFDAGNGSITVTDGNAGDGDDGSDLLTGVETLVFSDTTVHVVDASGQFGAFTSIQDAVDAAEAGDTIVVIAGDYAETVTVGKQLTILGANAGVAHDGARGEESSLTGGIHVLADGVVIDGLEIVDGASFPGETAAGIFVEADGVTVANSVFNRTGTLDFDGSRGLVTATGAAGGLQVTDSAFSGWHAGAYINPGTDATVTGNAFGQNMVGMSVDFPDGVTVTGNTFANNQFEHIGTAVSQANEDLGPVFGDNTFDDSAPDVSIYPLAGAEGQAIAGTDNDDLFNGDQTDTALGQSFAGGAGNDTVNGGGGNDTLDGGLDDDSMSGGAGDDLLVATSGDDTVDGGDGSDTVVVHDNGGAALGGLRDFDLSGVSASGGALSGTLGTPDGRTVTLAGVEVVKVAETGSSTFLVLDGMSIQAAIDAAEAGDTILVQNGTYTEDLTLKDGISVIGESEAGVVLNGTVSTPTTLQDAVLSGMTVQNVGDTMLLDMRGTTAVTDVVFEQVTFSLTSDFTGPIAIGNGQGGSTMAIADGDGDDAGLVFRNVTMASNDHDFASATAFAYTLVESVDGARMVLDGVVLSGTATGTGSGLGAQWNMSPQDNGKSAAVEIVNSQTSRGGNFYVSGFDSVLIQDNVFDGQGIALNGVENAVVTGNTFQNIDDTFTANGTQHRGLTIEDAWGTDGVSNLVVTGNTFTNITAVDGAIAFRTFNGGTPPDVATVERLNQVQITGNTFTGLGVGVEAIFILDQYFGPGAVLPAQFGLENLIIGTSDDDVITAPTDGGTGIFADAGNDSLTGGGGNDQLSGGGGNDTLDGGAGGDEMAGGDGDDTYVVDDDGDIVVEAAGEGHDVVRTTLNRYDLPDHVEDLVFEGNGRLIAHGNAEDNTIGGTKRHDRLFGGDGNDTLTGGPGEDSLYGQGGDDLLVGGGGSDILRGGAGDDVLRGGGSADMLIGNGGRDTLIGAGGNDTLNGGGGADVMIGGAGNDTYVVNAAGDVVEETANGGNHDEVQSGNLSLDLADYANIEDATLTGTGNLDLTGNDDRNRLTGNDGDNTIFGGLGGDILTGGGGADVFVYTAVEQSTQGADRDRIADFEQGFDLIDLFAIDAKDAAPGNNAFVWLGTDAFSGAEGELRYSVNNAGHARVQADTNGDGVADFEIVVLNAPLLNDGDFML